jgi:DNA-binding SARP family transcriptional activator
VGFAQELVMSTPEAATKQDLATTDAAFQLGVLGPLQISAGDRLLPLGTPKQRAVLAIVIINRNRPVAVDTLMDAVWAQQPPDGARATVHSYISNLRRLFSNAGADGRAVLPSAPPGYRLVVDDQQCDDGRFIAKKNAGLRAAAAGQFEQASHDLAAALAHWRGPVLDDLRGFGFVDAFAQPLQEDKVVAQTALAETEIACGRATAVIGELEALVAEHAYREPLWAQLITAYYLTDRQSDALDAYRRCKTTLADDLGIDPGPSLRALQERILRQEPLDVRKAAQTHAEDTIIALQHDTQLTRRPIAAALHDADGERHELARNATRIGRGPDNDIVLSDGKVSRQHAVITNKGTAFVITDLASANGVRVQGKRIHTSVELRGGDRIAIGDHSFVFEVQPASSD